MNAVLQPRRKGAVKGRDAILTVQVPAWHVGVLKIDGETQALLPPGLTAYWKINHLVEAEVVDTTPLAGTGSQRARNLNER